MLGYTSEALREIGGEYTAEEICRQPDAWLKTLAFIEARAEEIRAFLSQHITPDTRIILTGAGTSSYVGDIARFGVSQAVPCRVESIPTTDIVSCPDSVLEPDVPTILVSFGRSGDSPESVGAFDLMQNNTRNLVHIVFTCDEAGGLARRAQSAAGSLLFVLPDETNDRGFAMTASFSSMLLAVLLFFDVGHLEENRRRVEALARQGQRIIEEDWVALKTIAETHPERLVYLGTGCLAALGKELALKNMELCDGRIVSIHENTLGFRHGPKVIVDDHTLVVILSSDSAYTRRYVHDLACEVHQDSGNHRVLGIAYASDSGLAAYSDRYFCISGMPMPAYYTCLNYVLYGQMLGFFNSVASGKTPDNPDPTGSVNRVVKGVTIYPYDERA